MRTENQRMFRQFNVITDAVLTFLALPMAFWLRFYVLPDGVISVPLDRYMVLNVVLVAAHLLLYAFLGLHENPEKLSRTKELLRLWMAEAAIAAVLLSVLFIRHEVDYSRIALAIYFILCAGFLTAKRIAQRMLLRYLRKKGYSRKHILLVGGGKMARAYLGMIRAQRHLGYHAVGYVAQQASENMTDLAHLGGFSALSSVLEGKCPDEVVCAIDAEDYSRVPGIIAACEKAGIKLSIVPFYGEYLTSVSQIENVGGMPMLNIRRIPLDSWGHAFCKRLLDIVGSFLLIVLTSPVMLVCAIGVYLSSPGPILFRQERVGRKGKLFCMYKFRSMRVNDRQATGWSKDRDSRKTPFGAFIRKYSIDELPQFFNVLKGDMSLVGPRPELPHFVNQFKEEIPLYMVKHQVRPGITGWAQICGFRGDTSIKERILHDIDYIEHWTFSLDIRILLITVFKGKFKNNEQLH